MSTIITVPPDCTEVLDMCFIIDSSGSIREEHYDNYNIQLEFLAYLISKFDVSRDKTRIGAVLFSEQVILQIRLNDFNSVDDIRNAVLGMPYLGGGTNSPEALRITGSDCFSPINGDRPAVSNIAILITDGMPYPPERRELTIQEATKLKISGVRLIVIGVTRSLDRELITTLSSSPQMEGVNFFTAADFTSLTDIGNDVLTSVCLAGNIDITEGKYNKIVALRYKLTVSSLANTYINFNLCTLFR